MSREILNSDVRRMTVMGRKTLDSDVRRMIVMGSEILDSAIQVIVYEAENFQVARAPAF